MLERALVDDEGVAHPFEGRIHILVAVRGADGKRRRQNPPMDQLAKKQRAKSLRGLPVLVTCRINEVAGPAHDVEIAFDIELPRYPSQTVRKTFALPPERGHD